MKNSNNGGIIYGNDEHHLISLRMSYDGSDSDVLDFHEYGKIRFFTGGHIQIKQKKCILSGGNVGIGTKDPSTQLDVSGTGKFTKLAVGLEHNSGYNLHVANMKSNGNVLVEGQIIAPTLRHENSNMNIKTTSNHDIIFQQMIPPKL